MQLQPASLRKLLGDVERIKDLGPVSIALLYNNQPRHGSAPQTVANQKHPGRLHAATSSSIASSPRTEQTLVQDCSKLGPPVTSQAHPKRRSRNVIDSDSPQLSSLQTDLQRIQGYSRSLEAQLKRIRRMQQWCTHMVSMMSNTPVVPVAQSFDNRGRPRLRIRTSQPQTARYVGRSGQPEI